MQKLLLASTLTLSALAIAALPAHAQLVTIPISNGNFAVTNAGYTTLPTFLSPAGTVNLTAVGQTIIWTPAGGLITTNTPAGADLVNASGSANLTDGRTATFTGGRANVRGLASITGAASWAVPVNFYANIANIPAGATLTFTNTVGQISIPAASLSNYPTPRFTIPVTGGTFTVTDTTDSATIAINSLLTPLGTANLTVTLPALASPTSDPNYGPGVFGPTTTAKPVAVSGIANGTVTLSDGRVATVSNQMLTLEGTATLTAPLTPSNFPYLFNTARIPDTATITGTITGGSLIVAETSVALPPPPVQPPVVPPVQPPVQAPVQPPVQAPVQPPVQPPVVPPAPTPKQPEFILGFATGVNLGGDPEDYLQRVEVVPPPIAAEDLPEVEQSSLAFSRIHPACNRYTR